MNAAALSLAQPAPPRRFRSERDDCWYVQITQGETHVSDAEGEVITTVLGSCIAACIWDAARGVGGMNHFLLPEGDANDDRGALRYGVNAMELLINGLLKRGASRFNLQAKLFGGANVIAGLSDVGSRNVVFAQQYLQNEGIPLLGGDLGGSLPRRVRFWPTSGRASQMLLRPVDAAAVGTREYEAARAQQGNSRKDSNDVELF